MSPNMSLASRHTTINVFMIAKHVTTASYDVFRLGQATITLVRSLRSAQRIAANSTAAAHGIAALTSEQKQCAHPMTFEIALIHLPNGYEPNKNWCRALLGLSSSAVRPLPPPSPGRFARIKRPVQARKATCEGVKNTAWHNTCVAHTRMLESAAVHDCTLL